MWYAIIATDNPDSLPLRKRVRPAHLERIQALQAEGRVLVAGPHPAVDSEDPGTAGFTGSLLILDFNSLEDAKAWIDADPYTTEGVFASIEVKPFLKVAP